MASSNKDATAVHDLVSLIQAQGATTVSPTDDAILSLLHARFRFDLPYTRIGSTSLIVVNPLKSLANTNDASAADYEEKTYRDLTDSQHNLQPHLYELASRVYLLMRRTAQSQSVVFRSVLPLVFHGMSQADVIMLCHLVGALQAPANRIVPGS